MPESRSVVLRFRMREEIQGKAGRRTGSRAKGLPERRDVGSPISAGDIPNRTYNFVRYDERAAGTDHWVLILARSQGAPLADQRTACWPLAAAGCCVGRAPLETARARDRDGRCV